MAGTLAKFLADNDPKIVVEVSYVKGSTPRERGAFMLVSETACAGTIGGGQLEYLAIDRARAMLAAGDREACLDIPLGPAIGQCCGGHVSLTFNLVTGELRKALLRRLDRERGLRPRVYLFGAGHVGHALARTLALLPFRVIVIETRQTELQGLPESVDKRLEAMPERIVAEIPQGSAVLILTHDHALDFMIGAEALKRSDLAYVGMIGSATKRKTFRSWLAREAAEADVSRLVLPIGGTVKDKRPEIIAALTAAEVVTALNDYQNERVKTGAREAANMIHGVD